MVLLMLFNLSQYFFMGMIELKELIFALQIDVIGFLLFLSLYFILFLIYNTRKEIRQRPIFIVEEEKVNE